jgi:hypothetical protein
VTVKTGSISQFMFVLDAHVVYMFQIRREELFVEGELRGQGRKNEKKQNLEKFLLRRVKAFICYNLRVL